MKIGYARVSTKEQNTEAQIGALHDAGCQKIFEEKESGGRFDRPELKKMLEQLREGDIVIVYKLDRLSRSLKDLLFIIEKIKEAGAGFKSLTESIDTTTAAGTMMMQLIGVFAEFERSMIRERTRFGLEKARKEGRIGGRPPKLSREQQKMVIEMLGQERTGAEIARLFNVSEATVSRLKNSI